MIFAGDWAPEDEDIELDVRAGRYVLNIEGPFFLGNHKLTEIKKAGPALLNKSLPPRLLNPVCVLANNHIMDYGEEALKNTISFLENENIPHCGAGTNISSARKPIILEDSDIKFGLISCCEHQFGVADVNSMGVAEYGPWLYKEITTLKSKCDYVIVSIHSGLEHSPVPSPYHRELYKSFIDAGADFIHGHHAHRVQSIEYYNGKLICYGMGNFVVSRKNWEDKPESLWSLAIDIKKNNGKITEEIFFLEIKYKDNLVLVQETNSHTSKLRLSRLHELNEILQNETLYASFWQEVAVHYYESYGSKFMKFKTEQPKPLIVKRTIKTFLGKPENPPSAFQLLLWKVMLSCVSHREMLITALQIKAGETEDIRTIHSKSLLNKFLL